MSVIALVGAGLGLASEIFKFLGDKQSLKYADKALRLNEEYQEELDKPVDEQDDSKVESLEAQIEMIKDLANAQLRAYAAKNS